MLGPAFVVSPGLLQKIYGARDDRAVRIGVGLNALGLALYALVPVVMGMIARLQFPDLAAPKDALPTLLLHGVPAIVGAIGLAAVFSAELSAADAVLFMLTTSLSQDFYKRFVNRGATDGQVLRVTRLTAVVAGALGVLVAILASDVIDALSHLLHVDGRQPVRTDSCRPVHPTATSDRRARRHRLRRDRRRRRSVRRRAGGDQGLHPGNARTGRGVRLAMSW